MRTILLIALLLGLGTAQAQGERNPFLGQRTLEKTPEKAPAAALRLPDVRPGPYLPPPPDASQAPRGALPPAPAANPREVETATPASATPGAFLSRESIEAARQRCRVDLETRSPLRVAATGGPAQASLKIEGGPGCVKALQSDASWVRADLEGTRVALQIDANPGAARRATLYIANVGVSLSLQVEQDAAREALPAQSAPARED